MSMPPKLSFGYLAFVNISMGNSLQKGASIDCTRNLHYLLENHYARLFESISTTEDCNSARRYAATKESVSPSIYCHYPGLRGTELADENAMCICGFLGWPLWRIKGACGCWMNHRHTINKEVNLLTITSIISLMTFSYS